jgi:hypothetical protein
MQIKNARRELGLCHFYRVSEKYNVCPDIEAAHKNCGFLDPWRWDRQVVPKRR